MNPIEIADWKLKNIENVVYVPGVDPEFICINGHQIKRFSNRRYHGLVLKISGKSIYSYDENHHLSSEPGMLTYLPMGKPYCVESVESGACFCVNFYIEQETDLTGFSYSVRNFNKWQGLFRDLMHAWNYQQPGYRARVFGQIYDMFASIAEDYSAHYLPAQQKNAITQMIGQCNIETTPQSIAELARQCGMSETYFRRIFRSVYGVSPKQYIMEARFRQAKALLSTTDTPIAEISDLCGFENAYAFSRAFRNHEGISPSGYRNNHRE